jgi:site-specific DNA-methyltransferase (adenine-specific)
MKIAAISFGPRESEVEEMQKAEDTAQLRDSIKERGLINPPTVRQANGSFMIVAGLRRLLALRELGMEETYVKVIEADEVEAQILNAHENLKRFNLPWWDQVQLTRRLHDLRQTQHGKGKGGRPKSGEDKDGWGIRDTARELGVAIGPLSEDINLAKAVEQDPSLKNIKDKKTAIRMVRHAKHRLENEAEAGLPSLQTADAPVNEVLLGSADEILRRLEDNLFDFCVTDPPWISFLDKKFTKDDETFPVFEQLFRVLKYNALAYVFVGHEDWIVYRQELPRLGFKVGKVPLIWNKAGGVLTYGTRPWEYGRDYELIMQIAKGEPILTRSTQQSSILTYKPVPVTKLRHPNQKPLDLIARLITDCSYEGNFMVDPFAGSGAHLVAAKKMKRRYFGIEREKDFHAAICKRLEVIDAERVNS